MKATPTQLTASLLIVLAASASLAGEPPVCFPERTVLWAAYLLDDDGNDFGIIRAGHTVRVLETGLGKDGTLSKVEIDKPFKFTAFVESRTLLAFTAREIDLVPGFSSIVKGVPAWVAKKGPIGISIGLADPHLSHKPEWEISAICSDLQGAPSGEISRDWCHGGNVRLSTVWTMEEQVYWEKDLEMVSVDGKHRHNLPSKEWVYLFNDSKDRVHAAFWQQHSEIVHRGLVTKAGMQSVPKNRFHGSEHMCCEGSLLPKSEIPSETKSVSPVQGFLNYSKVRLTKPTQLRSKAGGEPVMTLPADLDVRAMTAEGDRTFVKAWMPSWDEDTHTIEIYGYVDSKSIKLLGPAKEKDK